MDNEDILKEIEAHYIEIQSEIDGISDSAVEEFAECEQRIFELIEQIYKLLGDGKIASDWKSEQKLKKLKALLEELRLDAADELVEELSETSQKSAEKESLFFLFLFSLFASFGQTVSSGEIGKILKYGKYHGLTQKQIIRKVAQDDAAKIYEIVADGLTRGMSLEDIKTEVQRRMNRTRRYVKTEVDAILHGVLNDAALAFAAKNRTFLLYVSVLDMKRCDECGTFEGGMFAFDDPELPYVPRHTGCRCHLVPVPEDFRTP